MADDSELWRRLTAGVTPLKGRIKDPPTQRSTPPRRAVSDPTPPAPPKPATGTPKKDKDTGPAPQPLGLDRRRAQRLKRGKLPVEARLDLHGMTQANAQVSLERFITSARARGLRCVLVITGKGRPASRAEIERPWEFRSEGVLRRAVPLWLKSPALAPMILSTSSARPEHGGAGALYVLLRRSRANGP